MLNVEYLKAIIMGLSELIEEANEDLEVEDASPVAKS